MRSEKDLKGFKVRHSPLASSALLVDLLLKKDYRAAEKLADKERRKAKEAAERYVASLVDSEP